MEIREMTFDDIYPVAEIEKEASLTPWDANGLFTWWLRDDTLFLTAVDGTVPDGEDELPNVLGYVGAVLVPWEGDILNITVRKNMQRRGIGTLLLQELLRRLPEKGVTELHLEVRAGNAPAIALYGNFGFVRDGLRKGYYTDPCEDAVLMTRKERK